MLLFAKAIRIMAFELLNRERLIIIFDATKPHHFTSTGREQNKRF